MNPKENPQELIGALGALEVQIANWLHYEALPVTQTHLCNVLHKTDKTVARALYNLAHYRVCSHSVLGWSITPEGEYRLFGIRQLPEVPVDNPVDKDRNFSDSRHLSASNSGHKDPTGPNPEEEHLPQTPRQEAEPSLTTQNQQLQEPSEPDEPVDNPVEKGRKFSDSSAPSSTSSIKLTSLKPEKNQLLEQLDPEPEPKKASEPKTGPKPKKAPEAETEPKSAEKIEECYETALAAGIWKDRARKLAEMSHVTPKLITEHVEAALAEGKEIQLAAYRMEQKWEVRWPKGMGGQNQKSQDLHECRKYVTGKYAAWVHH
jgi:hypothetical protein